MKIKNIRNQKIISAYINTKEKVFFGNNMRRMIGFILFWIAIGMLLMLFIHNTLIGAIMIAAFLLLGYNLFC